MGAVIAVLASGFLIGAAARWILPGPDPMPAWLTVSLGLVGSLAGGAIAALIFGTKEVMGTSAHFFITLMLEIAIATGLLIAYRRFVQRRPVAGPEAHRFPTRGIGVARLRKRLQQVGIDPETLSSRGPVPPGGRTRRPQEPPEPAPPEPDDLETLRGLHERGVLTDEEFDAARGRLEER